MGRAPGTRFLPSKFFLPESGRMRADLLTCLYNGSRMSVMVRRGSGGPLGCRASSVEGGFMTKKQRDFLRACLVAFTILAVSALSAQPLGAQEITGGITGTVTDPSGAAVPGAKVTAT